MASGALRMLDLSSLAILFAASRSWLARWLTVSPLVSLGGASLQVFCAASAVLLHGAFFCRGRKRFARMGTVDSGRYQFDWSLHVARSFAHLRSE
jgi:hypothetical protein